MTQQEALAEFKKLIAAYGIKWTNKVPDDAWKTLQKIEKILPEEVKRDVVLGRFRG